MTRTLAYDPGDLALVHAGGERHRELHGYFEPLEALEQPLSNAIRTRLPQCRIGSRIRAIELQQHEELRRIAREPLRQAGPVERDPVRRQVDFRDARLCVQEVQDLPELRV